MTQTRSPRGAILKDMLVHSSSTILVVNITLVLAVFTRRMLGPEAFGVWAILQVVLKYASYGNLGVFGGMYRQIPMLRGAGQLESVKRVKNTALTFGLATSSLAACVLGAGTLFMRPRLSDMMFWGLVTICAVNVLQILNNLLVGMLYTDKLFRESARFKIISAIVNAALVIPLTLFYSIYGFFAATAASLAFNVAYLLVKTRGGFRLEWHSAELATLLKVGVPVLALGFFNVLFNTIDRIAIGHYLSLADLGHYTIATMAGGDLMMVPNMFQQILYPRILEKFGGSGNSGMERYSTLPVSLVSIYCSLCIGLIWLAAPWLITALLPEFAPGIPALKALSFGYAFYAMSIQIGPVLFGQFRHLRLIPIAMGGTVCIYALSGWATEMGGIAAIAWVMTAAYAVYYAFGAWFALRPIFAAGKIIRQIASTALPLILCFAAVSALDAAAPSSELLPTVLKTGVYAVLWTAVIALFHGKIESLLLAKEVLTSFRRRGAAASEEPPRAVRKRACPLCGQCGRERRHFEKRGFVYVRCPDCGLLYVADVPDDNVHFHDDFFPEAKFTSLEENPARSERMGRFTADIRAHFGSRRDLRILDVGCGKGWNLSYLKRHGIADILGVDINRSALAIATAVGVPVREGLLQDHRFDEASYDVILMDQVIEHLEDPRTLLKEVRRVLAPGGLLWSSVPNAEAWHIRLFLKQRHRHFSGDRHLNMFTPKTYERLMREAGLSVHSLTTYFEELTLQNLKGVLFNPGDFDPRGGMRGGSPDAVGAVVRRAPASGPSKKIVRRILFPINAVLVKMTRIFRAGAYLECEALKPGV